MVTFPPCKINLGLHVINKRPDGYHNLETCFYPVQWTDILEIIPSENLHFSNTGNNIPGTSEENLCLQAYHLLKKDFQLKPVHIHLHKIIPAGAGLGGGSSDAAYMIRMLSDIFDLNLSIAGLMKYASQLGSDCSFFIQDKPLIGISRGEILEETSLNLAGKFLVIIKPEIHVSTAEAYREVTPKQPPIPLKEIIENYTLNEWKALLVNDFEGPVFEKYPLIRELKENLYASGAVYASMSGSGCAVFGIFENPIPVTLFSKYITWRGILN